VNLCRACGLDFGSVSAFDAHRVGRHEYTFSEGLSLDAPREDGRRCLSVEELEAKSWGQDSRGRWRQPVDPEALLKLRESRRTPAGVRER
jgi:hypothetical protein